jgi:hypothetical protein
MEGHGEDKLDRGETNAGDFEWHGYLGLSLSDL